MRSELFAFLKSEETVSCRRGVSLSSLTSMHTGGAADTVLSPRDTGALIRLLDFLTERGIPYRIIGNGTNLIAPDGGYDGVIVLTAGLDRLSVSDGLLRAGAGVSLSRLANAARESSLSGMEELYGIPGTLGGGLAMNAGAYGRCVSDCLESATVYHPSSREVTVMGKRELAFGYRTGRIRREGLIVLSAVLRLSPGDGRRIGQRMREIAAARADSQPIGLPSAGSVFLRPPGERSAGALIEAAGLKGTRIGGAEVSEKHAGFIVNRGGASTEDIRALVGLIRERVREHAGVELVCEIEFM